MTIEERPHEGQGRVPVPRPSGDHEAGLDARIRLKLDRGEKLDAEERAFLARIPGARDVMPAEVGPDTAAAKPEARKGDRPAQ